MHIFSLLRKKHGSLHWYGQRATALIIAPLIFLLLLKGASLVNHYPNMSDLLFNLKDQYTLLMMIAAIFIVWHAKTGFESIFDDYIHHEYTKFISYTLVRILSILIIKYCYLFIVL